MRAVAQARHELWASSGECRTFGDRRVNMGKGRKRRSWIAVLVGALVGCLLTIAAPPLFAEDAAAPNGMLSDGSPADVASVTRANGGAVLPPPIGDAGIDRNQDAGSSPSADGARKSLADALSPWFAIAIGAVGSAGYLLVLWVGLIGAKDGKPSLILEHFRTPWYLKVPLYIAGGGAVAMIFQIPEAKLVPIQAFIIGCTWPAVVANYLSQRQSGEAGAGEAQARDTAKEANAARNLPQGSPVVDPSAAKSQLDAIIRRAQQGQNPPVPPAQAGP
jgi:hypothetical protein